MNFELTMDEIQCIALAAMTWCQAATEANDAEEIKKSRAFANKLLPLMGMLPEGQMLAMAARGEKKTESGIIL